MVRVVRPFDALGSRLNWARAVPLLLPLASTLPAQPRYALHQRELRASTAVAETTSAATDTTALAATRCPSAPTAMPDVAAPNDSPAPAAPLAATVMISPPTCAAVVAATPPAPPPAAPSRAILTASGLGTLTIGGEIQVWPNDGSATADNSFRLRRVDLRLVEQVSRRVSLRDAIFALHPEQRDAAHGTSAHRTQRTDSHIAARRECLS